MHVLKKFQIGYITRLINRKTFGFTPHSIRTSAQKTNKKMCIISQTRRTNGRPPIIQQMKQASEVVKRLNCEFMNLYGPLLKSEGQLKNVEERSPHIFDLTRIVQHQSQIPIIDSSCSTLQESDFKTELDVILSFPLLNRPMEDKRIDDLQITRFNSLRTHLQSLGASKIPSVTAILEKTMPLESRENLRRWKENLTKQLGEEGFKRYQEELLANGISLHTCINNYLMSIPEAELGITEAIAGHWKSLESVLPLVTDVKLIEERVSHPFLHYTGIVDCFAVYRDHLVVIDWKTSKKNKFTLSSTFDNPLQIAAYVGALNFDPKFQYLVNKGLIIIAYQGGTPASAHFMNEEMMHRYWKEWLMRVKMFWEMDEESRNERKAD